MKTRGRERILNVVLACASLLIFLGRTEIFCRIEGSERVPAEPQDEA